MTRMTDLESPFVDGELPADETNAGGLPHLLNASPFASLTLAHRPPAPPAEAPPPAAEALPLGEVAEKIEAAPVFELALEGPEAMEEPASPEVSTEVAAETSLALELEDSETEAQASASEEAHWASESDLDRELREALELEPEAAVAEAEDSEAGADEVEQENETLLGTVTIVLDQPSEADDTFTLQSDDRKYVRTLGPKSAQPLVAGAKVLRFEGVDTTKAYQLLHKRSSASAARRIFPLVPFVGLTEHHTARKPRAFLDFDSQAQQTTSGRPVDPLLIEPSPGFVHLTDVRA